MNETYTITIGGRNFFIDIDAYQRLNDYLSKLKSWFSGKEGSDEIIADIENRLAELFMQKINPDIGVINIEMTEDAIGIMGQPEDFEDEESESNTKSNSKSESFTYTSYSKKLYRDIDNRVFGGVCGGIAAYFSLDPSIVRLLYVVLTLFTAFAGIPVYIILWIVLPPAITTAQKLEMKGESINISNIERKIKEEYEEVKNNFKNSDAYKKSEEYFKNKSNRDRNIIIAILVVVGLFIFIPMLSWMFHGLSELTHFSVSLPMGFIHPLPIFPIILILLVIGLISRNLLKPILYIIVGLILLGFILKLLIMLTGGFFFFT